MLADDGPQFDALEAAVRAALAQPPRRKLEADPNEQLELGLLSVGDCGGCAFQP